MEEEYPQWEYTESETLGRALNDLGREGWEAYAIATRSGGNTGSVLLKRKVRPPKQKSDGYNYGR